MVHSCVPVLVLPPRAAQLQHSSLPTSEGTEGENRVEKGSMVEKDGEIPAGYHHGANSQMITAIWIDC